MSQKTFIWIGLFLGSAIGGYVPVLWGGSIFSFSSILLSAVGAIFGIILGLKVSKMFF